MIKKVMIDLLRKFSLHRAKKNYKTIVMLNKLPRKLHVVQKHLYQLLCQKYKNFINNYNVELFKGVER